METTTEKNLFWASVQLSYWPKKQPQSILKATELDGIVTWILKSSSTETVQVLLSLIYVFIQGDNEFTFKQHSFHVFFSETDI